MSRIILIHGWGGGSGKDWLHWARKEFVKKGFKVIAPDMPDTNHPKINVWIDYLNKVIGKPRLNDILIGHSIGCQTILRYLEGLSEHQMVKEVILIAPWWFLKLGDSEEQKDADPWLKSTLNFTYIRKRARKFVCVFSDNDPYVPLQKNLDFFKKKLSPEIIIKKNMGHFTKDDGVCEINFLLKLI